MNCQVEIIEAPINQGYWAKSLKDPDTGSHAWFAGVTRRKTVSADGRTTITKTLHYEAHQSMAQKQLQKLADDAAEQFSLIKVVIVHRIGEVPLGEASVLVGCSSAHRRDSFAALPWIMDRLKSDVPIWKRETYDDDTTQWVHPAP